MLAEQPAVRTFRLGLRAEDCDPEKVRTNCRHVKVAQSELLVRVKDKANVFQPRWVISEKQTEKQTGCTRTTKH